VGRDRELTLLRELSPQVEGGRGQVLGIIGEPGVGKSRLCDEFVRGGLAQPWLILETQGTAYGQATPYLPIIDLLKSYFRIEDRDALPTVCEKVTATLRGLDDALTSTAPAILTLLDVPVEDQDGRRSMPLNAASAPWTLSSACCCGRARSSPCYWSSRTSIGSIPRPRQCSIHS
jgi:AAA ATPase domain